MTSISIVETPVGPFSVIVDDEGSVLASGWTTDAATLLALVHPELRGDPRRRPDLGAATRAVRAYLDGNLTAPDDVPVRQQVNGSFSKLARETAHGFLPAAWATLRKVAPGEPVSYTEFAALAGRPPAIRAAAQACARNAAALFVPCHRVIRADGSLGGFRWGLDTKRWLLAHESSR